jgi:hypothetical protein
VEHLWERGVAYRFLLGKSEYKRQLGNIGVDERIMFKWIVNQ